MKVSPLLVGFTAMSLAHASLQSSAYHTKRQTGELRDSYDFVVVGGGTSGLTVADRLSEAFGDKNILVVEYGEIENTPGTFDPPKIVWGEPGGVASAWDLNSTPSPALNNATAYVRVGKVVGGSSAINGMFFDRGSRHDYDTWDQLQGPNATRWNWDSIYPYFKKSVTFMPPPANVAAKHNYTWDADAFGYQGPIYASLPPFQWADLPTIRKSWLEMGIPPTKDCATGIKDGLCWIPESQNPLTGKRSHAGIGHYSVPISTNSRFNYDLLVKHQAIRVVYPGGDLKSGPPVVEILSRDTGKRSNITVKAEVILSAGVFHTPTILQRSGIGPASFLKSAKIPVVLDLPGVGNNLHDHSGARVEWKYTTPPHFPGAMPSDMFNATFAAEAVAAFNQVPAQGPYTLALGNIAIWLPLANLTSNATTLLSRIRTLATASLTNSSTSMPLYLPLEYASDPTLLAGYQTQLLAIADLLTKAPSLETAFGSGNRFSYATLHPLSRGTVRLNLSDPLSPPILDYRSASNPLDLELHLANLKYVRRMLASPSLRTLGAVETAPGEKLQSDEELIGFIRRETVQSFMHPCCTTAMLPLDKGGVVASDLKVYGAKGLRIVDAGVFPILPSSHLSATAYAVAEKAADVIIGQWKTA